MCLAIVLHINLLFGDVFVAVAAVVEKLQPSLRFSFIVTFCLLCILQVWKAILTGPLTLLSVALSTADNPFPAKKMSGEKCVSWTKAIDLELIKEIKMRTGDENIR